MNIKTLPRVLAIGLGSALALGAVNFAMAQSGAMPNNENDTDSEQPVTDTWITTKVKTELATTDGVSSMDIDVETLNGVVTLTGVLDSQSEVDKAVAAAQSVKGVTSVDSSGLTVRQ